MRQARVAAMVSGMLVAGCSVFGIRDATEEPRYTVDASPNGLEIRTYSTRIAAETTVPGDADAALNQGFRRIAGYIFGGNRTRAKIDMTVPVARETSQKIAMTAPVGQTRAEDGQWIVRFFMPAEWTLETLPTPDDPSVVLVPVPGETVAVLRFTGFWGADTIAARQAELLQRLQSTPWKPVGTPLAWFYDPPWTIPFLRRNEVAVKVEKR